MRVTTFAIAAALLVTVALWRTDASAQNKPPSSATVSTPTGLGTEYSESGADTCLECHDEEADTATFTTANIFKSPHGQHLDSRTPFGPGGLQCEACHGPGDRHARGSQKTLTINSFKASSFLPVERRNEFCLSCHRQSTRTGWHAGAHERAGLACTDCHKIHVEHDPVLAKGGQADVCFLCHKEQRAEFQKASSHPVRFGRMDCGDCHNPHGSNGRALLIQPTVNQACFGCHAEKRGPLLWEHAPVAEDCTLCHTPHGSVRESLLNKSAPLLCQQCHSVAGHPAVARTGAGLPQNTGSGSIFLTAGSCTNCHTQVHGSNHPAGSKLMR